MKKTIIFILVVIALAALYLIVSSSNKTNNSSSEENTIRIGYIVYPPLLVKDPTTGALSGVSYDIVEAVAKRLDLKTDWAEEVGWGTALEGLNTNRYDVLGTQMWPNEAREKVATFSIAPMDSVLYPYVKKGDIRFNSDLSVLNSSEYTISAIDGELAVFIAQEDYPKARLVTLSQLSSYAEVFLNIVQKKADVSFNEPSAAADFLKSHPNTIERIGNEPVRAYGDSFAFNKNNPLVNEWSGAIQELLNNGEIEKILKKYEVETLYRIN
ncbi:MAG: transporter substrate-binding domain-containing protein [Patescibacteria group bacterium]